MTTTLRKGSTEEEFARLLEDLNSRAKAKGGLDAKKYCGSLKMDIDPLEIQKDLRDEWE
jgi:hypothetical protein